MEEPGRLRPNGIVTLPTDFGAPDRYVGALFDLTTGAPVVVTPKKET